MGETSRFPPDGLGLFLTTAFFFFSFYYITNFCSSALTLLCFFFSLLPDFTPAGPSGTNIIIGSVAGAILLAAIILGGTGWGFK